MNDEYSVIPERTMAVMKAYAFEHQPTGSFLRACFSNDLKGAIGIADDKNFPALKKIICWIVNVAPFECQGSREKCAAWTKDFKGDAE